MSKKRVIACLVLRDSVVVQSIGFEKYLPVGRADIAARFLDDWGADEIVLLDITASREGRLIDPGIVRAVARRCRVPLTAGGGIRTAEDVRKLIQAGADKVCINSLLFLDHQAVKSAIQNFGSQCIVASIDIKRLAGRCRVMRDGGRIDSGFEVVQFAREVEALGVGEILLNSIDRDGRRIGFDIEATEQVAGAVGIPVIALGGAGAPEHLLEMLQQPNVAAAAAANMLHYTEHSLAAVKSYMLQRGADIRLDSEADYRQITFDEEQRAGRRPEEELLHEVFEFIPREII